MTSPSQSTAPNSPEETAPSRWDGMNKLVGGGWIFVLLIGLIALFAILKPAQFASPYNMSQLMVNAAILLVLASGQTFVIISEGIDLSVGSVLVFSSIASASAMLVLSGAPGSTYGTTAGGWDIVLIGLVVALGTGALWGAFNGFLISFARLPPLIVTLGTLGMALGFAQLWTNGQDVRAVPELLVTNIGSGNIFGIPILVVIAIVTTIICGIVLHLTKFGLHTFAVGSNVESARRAGIRVKRQIILIYALAGTLAGLAAMMSIARFSTTTIGGQSMTNLTVITAVVLGGTSLFGGVGTIAGTAVGVFIPIILTNGFIIMGIPPFWQTVAMGAVLLMAVFIDQLKRRSQQRG